MPDFHVFYYRHRTGEMIDSYAPKPMPRAHILPLAHHILEDTGDFIGLLDEDDGLLQFMVLARDPQDPRPIRLDMPAMNRQGAFTQQLSPNELTAILQSLPDKLTIDAVCGGVGGVATS